MSLFTRLFLLLLCSTALISCTYIHKPAFIQNRDTHYLTARSIPPLRMPPGISSYAFQSYYPVSDRYDPESAKSVSLVPPGL